MDGATLRDRRNPVKGVLPAEKAEEKGLDYSL
jgi:hypothetical protein